LPFALIVVALAVLAGALAAVTGFGIGSVLTPVLSLEVGAKVAVAAIAIPHAIGTAQRFWLLRAHVDRRILLTFGLTSAAGGLAGALVHTQASSRALAVAFGVAVVAAGMGELTGWTQRVHWNRSSAWVAGLASGLLGGLVGNQGGIRSAALLGFDVPRESFVATATAIGLLVDAARLPVYIVTQGADLAAIWPLIALATIGVVLGTSIGTRVLGTLPQRTFRRVIGAALVALGAFMLLAGGT
jgi:uncharacterized membrane protein YfcA